jgi:2-dehydro-3-deoxyphosphooctonate aldolase (KDO 8-P synthase)
MRIGSVDIGDGAPLALIGGLNVLEDEAAAIGCAETLARLSEQHGIGLVFKASYDKANRTRADGFRGPGIEEGLRILASVKHATDLPLLTDVHDPDQAKRAAEVVDCLQVPAFLCRQTDLLAACASTGRAINLKKGQFVAPEDMRHAVDKLRHYGASDVVVTERGTSFGYHDLVADMRALPLIREFAPVCFDATHAVQRPGARDGASGGDRRFVAPLARAAVAVGVDALFVEVHGTPESAPVDGACQLDFAALEALLSEARAVDAALRS